MSDERKQGRLLWYAACDLAEREGFGLIGATSALADDAERFGKGSVIVLGMRYDDVMAHPLPRLQLSSYYPAEHRAYHAAGRIAEKLHILDPDTRAHVEGNAKAYARRAGLGEPGRNTLLYHRDIGSRFTLQLLYSPLLLPLTAETWWERPIRRACNGCMRCVSACPTRALDGLGGLDRSLCLRAWMLSGQPVPEPMRERMEGRLLGCEICQRACPDNERLPRVPEGELAPYLRLSAWCGEDADFTARTRALAELLGPNLIRPMRLRCQLALLMGNSGERECLPTLARWAGADSPALREHAAWAIERIERRG